MQFTWLTESKLNKTVSGLVGIAAEPGEPNLNTQDNDIFDIFF